MKNKSVNKYSRSKKNKRAMSKLWLLLTSPHTENNKTMKNKFGGDSNKRSIIMRDYWRRNNKYRLKSNLKIRTNLPFWIRLHRQSMLSSSLGKRNYNLFHLKNLKNSRHFNNKKTLRRHIKRLQMHLFLIKKEVFKNQPIQTTQIILIQWRIKINKT